jgi:hypothetical protein
MAGDANTGVTFNGYNDASAEHESEQRAVKFSELYDIDPGIVTIVMDPALYLGSATEPDSAFPKIAELFLKGDMRLMAIALADPNMLQTAQGRLGDLEIPDLNTFFKNVVALDEKAEARTQELGRPKDTYAWITLRYTDTVDRRDHLLFMYRDGHASSTKEGLLPYGFDVAADDVLQGPISPELVDLTIKPRAGHTRNSFDTHVDIGFGEKKLVIAMNPHSFREGLIDSYKVTATTGENTTGSSVDVMAKPICLGEFGESSLVWQRANLGGGCSTTYPSWH